MSPSLSLCSAVLRQKQRVVQYGCPKDVLRNTSFQRGFGDLLPRSSYLPLRTVPLSNSPGELQAASQQAQKGDYDGDMGQVPLLEDTDNFSPCFLYVSP